MEIDWKKDYQGDFVCPECKTLGLRVRGINKSSKKRLFYCPSCRHVSQESCQVNIQAIPDPITLEVVWYTNYKYQDFICPKCQSRNFYFLTITKHNKRQFRCATCKTHQVDSLEFNANNRSRYGNQAQPIQTFRVEKDFDKDKWDLRGINPNFDERDKKHFIINFSSINLDWFKQEVKKYIYHLCKAGHSNTFSTITSHLSALRFFARYLKKTNITGFHQINRSLMLSYLTQEKKGINNKLSGLRSFFSAGNIRGWFSVDPDIIRDEDYPKQRRGNPDPLSDTVREQIEKNLHKLPAPIARMWIVCFFAAMRPSELALLKKDCLVQEGQHWKLVWGRKKTKDYHEIPISRTIAKVVQEQLDYINDLWGKEWDYLFCHYQGLSTIDVSQPKLEPVKTVIPTSKDPFVIAIRCLIKSENILDENGKLAKFKPKLLKTTRLTQLFEQGHDIDIVSAWAGHKHWATTSTYYTEVSCEQIEREVAHIQQALVNVEGHKIAYESFPKSFWENPQAHRLEIAGTHINTPIYGYCGMDLDQDCEKFRACYTCSNFVAVPEKLPQYIKVRDKLRGKQTKALTVGDDISFDLFRQQADQLDKIIASLQEVP